MALVSDWKLLRHSVPLWEKCPRDVRAVRRVRRVRRCEGREAW